MSHYDCNKKNLYVFGCSFTDRGHIEQLRGYKCAFESKRQGRGEGGCRRVHRRIDDKGDNAAETIPLLHGK